MNIQYVIDLKGKKKGVFLSLNYFLALQKKLYFLQKNLSEIAVKREQILKNYRKSRKELHRFSSDMSELKEIVK